MRLKLVILYLTASALTGCSATHRTLHHHHPEVQTQMSSTVLLDPLGSNKRSVFLQIHNTSDKSELQLRPAIAKALTERGYCVASAPDEAHYWIQANILQAGKTDLNAALYALDHGFGTAFSHATAATNSLGQNSVYSLITDVQISQRVGNSFTIQEKKSKFKPGTNGIQEITSTEKTNWKRYQTRIVSTATKTRQAFKKAAPSLITGITRSIAGVF